MLYEPVIVKCNQLFPPPSPPSPIEKQKRDNISLTFQAHNNIFEAGAIKTPTKRDRARAGRKLRRYNVNDPLMQNISHDDEREQAEIAFRL